MHYVIKLPSHEIKDTGSKPTEKKENRKLTNDWFHKHEIIMALALLIG